MDRIGRYELRGELGRGGFGVVYRALDPVMRRQVAIKVLTAVSEPESLARFRAEAGTTGSLVHNNIITVFDFGEHEGLPYLVMELLDGTSLLEIMQNGPALPLFEKVNILVQVAEGLNCAHEHGVVHRDVKPANVMVLKNGAVKILDFGIARFMDQSKTRHTMQGYIVGTIEYMAPEQLQGGDADVATDVFAWGVMAYELLSGTHPFRANHISRVVYLLTTFEPKPLAEISPECQENLARVVHIAMAKDRAARYPNLQDLLLDLKSIQAELRKQRAAEFLGTARGLLAAQDLENAQAWLRKVLELDPASEEAQALLRQLQLERERHRQVAHARDLVAQGQRRMAENAPEAAIPLFQDALQSLPAGAPENYRSGIAGLLRAAEQARDTNRLIASLLDAARAQAAGGDFDAAARNAREILQLDPAHAEARSILERCQAGIERQQELTRLREEQLAREAWLRRVSEEVHQFMRDERFADASTLVATSLREFDDPSLRALASLVAQAAREHAARREQERQRAEQARAADAQRREQERRAEEERRQAEQDRAAEAQRREQERRAEEERQRAEQARAAEAQRREQERRAEEERQRAEQARAAEALRREQERRAEEERRRAEQDRAAEAQRREQERRAEEELRRAEQDRAEAQRREQERRAEEELRQAAESLRQEHDRREQAAHAAAIPALRPGLSHPILATARRHVVLTSAGVVAAAGLVALPFVLPRSKPAVVPKASTITGKPPAGPVILDFTAEPRDVEPGQPATLRWRTSPAVTHASIDQGIGSVDGAASYRITPGRTITYTLTAEGPGGAVHSSVTVTVSSAVQAPTIGSFHAQPDLISSGQSAVLSWNVGGKVTRVTIDQGVGSVARVDTRRVSPAATTTYTLTASGPAGSVSSSVVVLVKPAATTGGGPSKPPTIDQFLAEPPTVEAGKSSTLRWSVTGSVTGVSIEPGIGAVSGSDSRTIAPAQTTTYSLVAGGPGGISRREVTVNVAPTTVVDPLAKDREAILQAIAAYSKAVENKDEQGIRAVWPSIPASVMKSWQSDFQNARSITLELHPSAPINPSNGLVRVECAARLRKEFAAAQAYDSQFVMRFVLRNQAGHWIIESAR